MVVGLILLNGVDIIPIPIADLAFQKVNEGSLRCSNSCCFVLCCWWPC